MLQREKERKYAPKRQRATPIRGPTEFALQTSGPNILNIKELVNNIYCDIILDTGSSRSIIDSKLITKYEPLREALNLVAAGDNRILPEQERFSLN